MMKTNINEMSEQEVLSLTPEQIDWLIRYACAEEGIRHLPEPVKPEPFKPEYDAEVYEVHGMYFATFEAAKEVKNALSIYSDEMRKLDYDWRNSSSYKYVSEGSFTFSVEKFKCFTPARYEKIAGELQSLEAEKRKYETLLKEYREEQNKMLSVKLSIYEVIESHRTTAYIREKSCNDYREYLKLANGNVETARRFFEKAYPGANHQEVYGLVYVAPEVAE